MSSKSFNWYKLLVDQSKTDDIYTLIHEGLSPDFNPEDPRGFVLIHPNDLPDQLCPLNPKHIAADAETIDEDGWILLKNNYLSNYLEAGYAFSVYEGKTYDYAMLSFHGEESNSEESLKDTAQKLAETVVSNPYTIFEEDDPLLYCWTLISRGENKELALQLAREGEDILIEKMYRLTRGDYKMEELIHLMSAFNIIAVAYAWNNQFEKAKAADSFYIRLHMLWPRLKKTIEPYLEMLIAKQQTDYLHQLFENIPFRMYFMPHYEAFISLLVDPEYVCSRMREMIPIINHINNGMRKYQ